MSESDSEYKCEDCGRFFKNERSVKAHQSVVDHERLRQKDEIRRLVESPDSEQHVYVIRVERISDRKEFLYVGVSNSVVSRLMSHLSGLTQGICLPDEDGRLRCQQYNMVGLVETIPCSGRKKARNKERVRMLELAIERGQTNIIGGR